MNILILGINGFIGFHLYRYLSKKTDWNIVGFDINDSNIRPFLKDSRLVFRKGDLTREGQWIEEQISKCDVVLPLIAIATPSLYIKNPVEVFELDFEENMKVVKLCVKHRKRIVFPSTSEVYGMSIDSEFSEDESNLIVGPICKQRWIYSSCKQLLDRVIWAYGKKEGLQFTLFRPFNWVGPNLDNVHNREDGSCRVVTQFISNVIHGLPLKLVNGGKQKRCFTYIDDGIECLFRIIKNQNNVADNQIFNIGNPENNWSIELIADFIMSWVKGNRPDLTPPEKVFVSEKTYYGESYEDVTYRSPSISKARFLLGWKPSIGVEELLQRTLNYYLLESSDALVSRQFGKKVSLSQ